MTLIPLHIDEDLNVLYRAEYSGCPTAVIFGVDVLLVK